uniref:Uncharacterized protein n=1 Tax=Glossina brevipalpis TaxID=37001 RepID=A0A1A9W6V4_9MUSC
MRGLILYVAFLSAVAGYQTASNGLKESSSSNVTSTTSLSESISTTEKQDSTPMSAVSSSQSSSTPDPNNDPGLISEVVSELPVPLPGALQELDKRRVVTYDQRQEGQYNIRADLENFLIILIPPSPADGMNLLDILTKASYRRTSQASKQGKKKHYITTSGSLQPEFSGKLRQPLKAAGSGIHNINFLPRSSDTANETPSNIENEFIEGRTPYHVDISSTGSEEVAQARMQPDRQVDVLPPSYPLAYQQLIKPYHLEAEATVIQALPPPELTSSAKHSPVATSGNAATSSQPGYFRLARAIRGENNFLDINRVASTNSLSPLSNLIARRTQLPIYRSDLSLGAAQLYPPLDVPHYTSYMTLNPNSRNFDLKTLADDLDTRDGSSQSLDSDLPIGEIIVPPANFEDDLELELHGGSFMDTDVKSLLSDGIERCAPGKRRDSYGVCREIEESPNKGLVTKKKLPKYQQKDIQYIRMGINETKNVQFLKWEILYFYTNTIVYKTTYDAL